MGLLDTAHGDLIEILNDTSDGGEAITITSPAAVAVAFQAFNNDIHLSIDPETGETVTGRQSTVAVLISALITAGFTAIRGIEDSTAKPWLVTTTDVNGVTGTFKVIESYPDNSIGLQVLVLEEYTPL